MATSSRAGLAAALALLAAQQAGAFVAAPTVSGRHHAAAKLQAPRTATPGGYTAWGSGPPGPPPGGAPFNALAVPPAADFKNFWDKTPPAYASSARHPRYSNQDWLHNLMNIPRSKMLRRVGNHLLANTIWALAILYLYSSVPAFAKGCAGMSTVPHSLAAGALSLLLVFRTNSAYDRFWEGRKLWGKLVNMTRELSRLGHTFLVGLDRDHYLALVAVFPSFLLQHLQGTENTYRPSGGLFSEKQRDAIHGLLGDGDMALLWKTRHRPFTITKMMGAIVAKAFSDPVAMQRRFGPLDFSPNAPPEILLKSKLVAASLTAERTHTEKMISDYADVYGACERIIKSAVPESYSRHTSRMLSVFCFTLPLALVHSLGWRMVPSVLTVCWMFFTIEEVGHTIEDPFNLHVLDPHWTGVEDQLRIEVSLGVLRADSLERLPAVDPAVYDDAASGSPITARDYDVGQFHQDWKMSAR